MQFRFLNSLLVIAKAFLKMEAERNYFTGCRNALAIATIVLLAS